MQIPFFTQLTQLQKDLNKLIVKKKKATNSFQFWSTNSLLNRVHTAAASDYASGFAVDRKTIAAGNGSGYGNDSAGGWWPLTS